MFRANIINDPSCHCGSDIEDVNHCFLVCPKYISWRKTLFNNLNWLSENCVLDTKLSICVIFKHVQNFIKRSNRFLMQGLLLLARNIIVIINSHVIITELSDFSNFLFSLFFFLSYFYLCKVVSYSINCLLYMHIHYTIIVFLYCIMEKTYGESSANQIPVKKTIITCTNEWN